MEEDKDRLGITPEQVIRPEVDATEPTEAIGGPSPVPPVVAPVKPKRSRKKLVLILLSIIVVVGGGVAAFLLTQNDDKPAPKKATSAQKPAETTPNDPILAKFIQPTTGEKWYSERKELPDQKLTTNPADADYGPKYYEIGTRGDTTLVMSITQDVGEYIQLFEKAKDGTVTYIAEPDGQIVYNDQQVDASAEAFKKSVKIDKTTHYDSLSAPAKLAVDNDYSITKPEYPSLGSTVRPSESTDDTKVSETVVKKLGGSSIRKTEVRYTDTNLTSVSYSLITPLNTEMRMDYEPLATNLGKYQWKTGTYVDSTIQGITRGCGGASAAVSRAEGLKDSDTVYVGQASDGQKVYAFADSNHTLVAKAYNEFKDYVGDDKTVPYASYTKDEFVKEHGLVLYKDHAGKWLLYVRQDLAPAYGCAKPVVYLYPTQAQQVRVKVGADVQISDPLYDPEAGWSVYARPNGQLTLNGRQYGSLFWEGPGIGTYPGITSGTVVKRVAALDTIRLQLAQQGLNQTEISDFMAYWKDKLPNKPYIRLTWLTTSEMNQLAPLKITPKPDTVIRVFLDFAGLDKPIKLPAQKLQAAPRTGFTVVEWGGLSPTKLVP